MEVDEVVALEAILEVSSQSLGPCARAQAFRTSDVPGAGVVISSSCSSVIEHWPVSRNHHLVSLVIEAVRGHLAKYSDGGWLFLNLSLRIALALLGHRPCGVARSELSISRAAALHGVALASSWLHEAFDDENLPCKHHLKWSDLKSIFALLRPVFCKPVAFHGCADAVRHLSVLCVEAFLHVLPGAENDVTGTEASIRYNWFCGPDVEWSSCIHGLVIDTPVAIATGPSTPERNLRIVLFYASLEQWLPCDTEQTGIDTFSVHSNISDAKIGPAAVRRWEIARHKRLADSLVAAGVRALGCQKLVDPWLCDNLHQRGITVMSRLSVRHIDHMQRMSGARCITSLASMPEKLDAVCGLIGPVEQRTIFQKRYTIVHEPVASTDFPTSERRKPVATLMIGSPDEPSLLELKKCVQQAVGCLGFAASDGVAFSGGGRCELALAKTIEARVQAELAKDDQCATSAIVAARVVADSLAEVAACLPASSKDASMLERGREVACEPTMADSLAASADTTVLEAGIPKVGAIRGALDFAGVLVRLGGVLNMVDACV